MARPYQLISAAGNCSNHFFFEETKRLDRTTAGGRIDSSTISAEFRRQVGRADALITS